MNQALTPAKLLELTQLNTSFSTTLPGLQLALDSTSMGALKECPRKYFYTVICGWQPRQQSVHLTFGLHYHAALEAYDHAKSRGFTHKQALHVAVKMALVLTWDKNLKRPWFSDDPYKNRLTLVRSVLWYLDSFEHDPMVTVQLSNGKPAVELSFRFETPHVSPEGLPFMWCGHLDRVGEMNGQIWILDRKTSKNPIDERYFKQFSPSNQMSGYTFAGKVAYKQPVQGIIIDACQILVSGTRFKRGVVMRDDAQLNEWMDDIGIYVNHAVSYAKECYWPMNDKSCGNFGGCPFQMICGKSPLVREQWLESAFYKRVWDPLQVRGDI